MVGGLKGSGGTRRGVGMKLKASSLYLLLHSLICFVFGFRFVGTVLNKVGAWSVEGI
jgi:hypothetical protein